MKLLRVSLWIILTVVVIGYACLRLSPVGQGLLPTGTGITAKQLCSLVFVGGLEPQKARDLYLDPLLAEALPVVSVKVDHEKETVTARVPLLVRQKAVHRPGYGCTLVQDKKRRLQPAPGMPDSSPSMSLDLAHRDAVFDTAKLESALERAFEQEADKPPLNTLAVAVLHDGRLVAEKYAPGISPETRLPGWSMTKSVTATLIGTLALKDKVDLYAPGALLEWGGTNDPRSAISVDHLLRMTSGLLMTESNNGYDPNSRMLFIEPDGAHFSATRELHKEVGSYYEYMSGSTVLAMRVFQEKTGNSLQEAHTAIQEDLFRPLGMTSAIIEPDQSGTFIGSSFMLASARDWARFGQLYLDDGKAGGQQIIPEDWLDYVTAHTEQSGGDGYGASFWIITDAWRERDPNAAALPDDTFSARGFQGQFTHIIPSRGLVVVRLGATNFGGRSAEEFPAQIVAAMKPAAILESVAE